MRKLDQIIVMSRLTNLSTVLLFNIDLYITHSDSLASPTNTTGRAAIPQMISRPKIQAPSGFGYGLRISTIAAIHLYGAPTLAT